MKKAASLLSVEIMQTFYWLLLYWLLLYPYLRSTILITVAVLLPVKEAVVQLLSVEIITPLLLIATAPLLLTMQAAVALPLSVEIIRNARFTPPIVSQVSSDLQHLRMNNLARCPWWRYGFHKDQVALRNEHTHQKPVFMMTEDEFWFTSANFLWFDKTDASILSDGCCCYPVLEWHWWLN